MINILISLIVILHYVLTLWYFNSTRDCIYFKLKFLSFRLYVYIRLSRKSLSLKDKTVKTSEQRPQ